MNNPLKHHYFILTSSTTWSTLIVSTKDLYEAK